MDTETLYEDSEFAAWLKTMPENDTGGRCRGNIHH